MKNPEAARLSGFFVVLQWIPPPLFSCIYPFYKDYCTTKRTVSEQNYKWNYKRNHSVIVGKAIAPIVCSGNKSILFEHAPYSKKENVYMLMQKFLYSIFQNSTLFFLCLWLKFQKCSFLIFDKLKKLEFSFFEKFQKAKFLKLRKIHFAIFRLPENFKNQNFQNRQKFNFQIFRFLQNFKIENFCFLHFFTFEKSEIRPLRERQTSKQT